MASADASGSTLSRRTWQTAVLYIVAVAMLLRFYDLPLKPLHHDEGVNALFLTSLVNPPHSYRYDPANYHGPTLYYFGWASAALLGLTTVAMRAVTAVAGLATVLLLLSLRRSIGSVGALSAAALLAVSPGAVYFSRYYIHEALLVCFTLAAIVAALAWVQPWGQTPGSDPGVGSDPRTGSDPGVRPQGGRGRSLYLYLSAASAGLMFATKETAIISFVVTVGALIGTAVLYVHQSSAEQVASAFRRKFSGPFFRLKPEATHAFTRSQAGLTQVRARTIVRLLLGAAAVFLAVNVVFYTSFFAHWEGAGDALRSFAIWTKTGTTDHTRSWHAYLQWLSAEELPLLLVGGAGAVWALWRRDNWFAVFAALFTFGTLAAYSLIPYKTPWLTLNVIVPLAITSGYAVAECWRRWHPRPALLAVLATVALAIGTIQAVVLNFAEYDNDDYPYVYAHTSREVLALVRDIDAIEALNPGASIAVTSRDHFPLSWYLRAYPAGYYGRPIATNDPIVIASTEQDKAIAALLGGSYERIGSYKLRPGVELVLYVRQGVKRRADGAAGSVIEQADHAARGVIDRR